MYVKCGGVTGKASVDRKRRPPDRRRDSGPAAAGRGITGAAVCDAIEKGAKAAAHAQPGRDHAKAICGLG